MALILESGLTTPRLRHSMIPRGPPGKNKAASEAEELSPKSVIAENRFISPASSESSSMDRHNGSSSSSSSSTTSSLSEPGISHLKLQLHCDHSQPRHDRGYSISDGEFSDPDTSCTLDTTVSLELAKVGNLGPLESLPETHSLALETASTVTPAEEMSTSGNACVECLEETVSNGELHGSSPQYSMRSNDMHCQGELQDSAVRRLQMPTVEDENNERSEWSQTSTSSGSAMEQDHGRASLEEQPSLRSIYTLESRVISRSQRRDHHSSRTTTAFCAASELSGDGQRERAVVVGPGAASNFGYPGTPLVRFSSSWSTNNSAQVASPRVSEKACVGSSSPAAANSTDNLLVGPRYPHRFLSGPIMGSMMSKAPPSKWDDAEKWIVSPGHSDRSPAQPQGRPPLSKGGRIAVHSLRYNCEAESPDYATPAGEKPMSPHFENAFIDAGKIMEPPSSLSLKKRSKALSFGDLSRRFDASQMKPPAQQQEQQQHDSVVELREDNPGAQASTITAEAAGHGEGLERRELVVERQPSPQIILNGQARSVSMREMSSNVVVVAPQSCMRDMGTQMTPVESMKNSTCTTPGFNTPGLNTPGFNTPGLNTSPNRHNTPARSGRRACSLGDVEALELQSCHLAKLELRKLSGSGDGLSVLDRNSVWTSREEEDMESAASLRADSEDLERCKLTTKANAWEEAERAKVLARYEGKQAKINAWEELQKSQAEAEMKKTQAKVERMLLEANEKMRGKVASAAMKAVEMRAAAEANRDEQNAKACARADLIRKTGIFSPPRRSFTSCLFSS